MAVRHALTTVPGVADAEVLFDEKRADVRYDPATVKPTTLVDAVNAAGFEARLLVLTPGDDTQSSVAQPSSR